MKVDPESPAVQGLTTFLAFVVLNLLYLMTCLPVVTIGVATSALYEVTFRYADEERGNLLRDYIAALGAEVAVERGAGLRAGVTDADYSAAGAKLVDGDGALAQVAVDRCLAAEPGHPLAHVMIAVMAAGLRPEELADIGTDPRFLDADSGGQDIPDDLPARAFWDNDEPG